MHPTDTPPTIDERFSAFHAANPHIYAKLVELTREAHAAGHERFGIRTIWEVLRWKLMVRTNRPADDFKLNDHYTSRYVRLIQAQEPDLATMFETRELRSVSRTHTGDEESDSHEPKVQLDLFE